MGSASNSAESFFPCAADVPEEKLKLVDASITVESAGVFYVGGKLCSSRFCGKFANKI